MHRIYSLVPAFVPARNYADVIRNNTRHEDRFVLIIANIKVFCAKCKEAEVFAPVHFEDQAIHVPSTRSLQLFALTYECQRCKQALVSFLVRREGWNMSLHGRSPMEQVSTHPSVPKAEQSLYRDAIVAMNSGKTLAALFYLRTFIEQFARRQTGLTGRVTGDEIIDAYNGTLPQDLRGQMPSLREWYDKLSEPLHSARPDEKVFEEAKEKIDQHFEIRRVFKIADASPPSGEKN